LATAFTSEGNNTNWGEERKRTEKGFDRCHRLVPDSGTTGLHHRPRRPWKKSQGKKKENTKKKKLTVCRPEKVNQTVMHLRKTNPVQPLG